MRHPGKAGSGDKVITGDKEITGDRRYTLAGDYFAFVIGRTSVLFVFTNPTSRLCNFKNDDDDGDADDDDDEMQGTLSGSPQER